MMWMVPTVVTQQSPGKGEAVGIVISLVGFALNVGFLAWCKRTEADQPNGPLFVKIAWVAVAAWTIAVGLDVSELVSA